MDRLIRFPRLWLFVSRACHWLHRIGAERAEILRLDAQLRDDLLAGRLERSIADHYRGGALEREKWVAYRKQFDDASESEVRFRNTRIRDEVTRLRPRVFVNFGCLYGWLEDQLGKSGVEAHGVDRSPETKTLNESAFPNATFHVADIVDFLSRGPARPGAMLAHINTGVYFLPAFLLHLYGAAYAAGFDSVLLWEPWGRSRLDGRYYEMDNDRDQPPKVFRGPMLLHNYARLLARGGFESIVRQKILRPPHPHPDFRSLLLVAKRR